MASYDLTKKADRERMRSAREAERQAVLAGTWPRDTNDLMRWDPPRGMDPARWAGEMCHNELNYLKEVDRRLAEGDPELEGWER